ncbi:OB-fold nucleic acid binding domain-containing protein, partial [Streptosporangium algeriense]
MISTSTRTLAADLPRRIGDRVTVQGWLHRGRTLKSVVFLILRDRSGLAQAVFSGPEAMAEASAHPEETVLRVTGTVTANPQAPGGAELTSPEVVALSGPAEAPPFDLYRPGVPDLVEVRGEVYMPVEGFRRLNE